MKKIIYLFVTTIAIAACKSSVEGETKIWNHNKEQITSLKIAYPSLASYLTEDITNAESEWSKALKVSGDEAKTEALEKVNKTLKDGFLGELVLMEKNNKNIESLMDEMDELIVKDITKSEYFTDDKESAKTQLIKYNDYKDIGFNAKDRQEALSIINLFLKNQDEEITDLKNVIAKVEKLMAKDTKTVSTSKDEEVTAQNKDDQPVFVKCKYCGNQVDQKIAKCDGCGANL
jgi:hypothetical protein